MTIVARLADALHAANSAEVPGTGRPMHMIHRDIKPGNILLGTHGGVTLLDFGIARADVFQRAALTAASTLLGSGAYTAPEVLMQEGATSASDIWGLGATAFEAITGTRLFSMPLRKILHLMAREDPAAFVRTRLIQFKMPDEARMLIGDMLSVKPECRPSAEVVMQRADDLADALGGTSLRRWATERSWPSRTPSEGDLDGQTLSEEPLLDDFMTPGAS